MSTAATPQQRTAAGILLAGAIAGAMDITAAAVQTALAGKPIERMLQGIASGWFGKASYQGGLGTAAIGFLSHFFIAFTWATLYGLASRRLPVLLRRAWAAGALYGLVVYAVMYQVVMPLSAIHRIVPRTPQTLITGLAIHIVCIGWPIALTLRAYTARRDTDPI